MMATKEMQTEATTGTKSKAQTELIQGRLQGRHQKTLTGMGKATNYDGDMNDQQSMNGNGNTNTFIHTARPSKQKSNNDAK